MIVAGNFLKREIRDLGALTASEELAVGFDLAAWVCRGELKPSHQGVFGWALRRVYSPVATAKWRTIT